MSREKKQNGSQNPFSEERDEGGLEQAIREFHEWVGGAPFVMTLGCFPAEGVVALYRGYCSGSGVPAGDASALLSTAIPAVGAISAGIVLPQLTDARVDTSARTLGLSMVFGAALHYGVYGVAYAAGYGVGSVLR